MTEPYILFAAFDGKQSPVRSLSDLMVEIKEGTELGQKAYSRLYDHFGIFYREREKQ